MALANIRLTLLSPAARQDPRPLADDLLQAMRELDRSSTLALSGGVAHLEAPQLSPEDMRDHINQWINSRQSAAASA